MPCARLHAVHVLRDWNLSDLADDTAVVVSELVANAVTASAIPPDRPPVSLRHFVHPTKPGLVSVAGKPSATLKPKTESSILKQAGLRKDRP